ncbi:MAG TPA: SusC/RagA family TonB-linked outer membrane protein, partial [Fodinibius sp.]|nr:SusC/RagA family TonB-linked outer membrane protein [Fodinibius sp.]
MNKFNSWLLLGLTAILQFSCISTIAQAQNTTVSGVVTTAGTGETLPGVNITVKGTTIGTSTDRNGKYELTPPSLADTLLFSFIGFQTREVPIDGRTDINVTLQSQALAGEEVVVVGYSQKSRGEITGSVADISSMEIAETSTNNITQAIQGKMPGVIVNSRGGGPGNNNAEILIRGQSTMGDNAPLIVIDGIPRSKNDFAHLSPNAIESISVLKDASAAIYGARAANGVILITTKKGQVGRPVIQLNSSYGVQTVTKYPEAMNAYQRARYWNEYYQYDGLQPLYTEEELEHFKTGDRPLAYPNTDWAEVVLSDFAPKTHHNLSASGGTENIQYYLSGDYLFQGGMYEANSLRYNQFQIRANVSSQVTDNLTIGVNLLGRQGKRRSSLGWEGVWQGILNNYPWLTARWPDGRLGPGLDTGNSALTDSDDEYGWINRKTYTFNSKLSFTYDLSWLTENLQLSGYTSFDYTRLNNKQFQDIWTAYSYNSETETFSPVQGHAFGTLNSRVLTIGNSFFNNQFYQLQLNYEKTFGDHTISAFAAYEQSENSLDTLSAYRRGLPSDKKVQLFAGSEIAKDNYGSASLGGRANYFGSISYDYADTYMLDLSLRYDGSFNFPEGSRFGLFPSVSAGWNISKESFLNSTNDWLDQLKLRLSWGKMGNDRVPAYQYLTRYQLGGTG